MDGEVHHIATLLQRTFDGDAWHGPSVKQVLNDITPNQADLQIEGTHKIIELVFHMVTWRIYVLEKLAGDSNYQVSKEMDFGVPGDWPAALLALDTSQYDLLRALDEFPDSRLFEQVPGVSKPLTFYTLLHSSIHHDLYHIGQIALIRKAFGQQSI